MDENQDFCGTRVLAKQLLRQALSEMLNRHVPGEKRNIALLGSRRSGSTLLGQSIALNKGVKYVDQPFSPFNSTPHHTNFLPAVSGGQYCGIGRFEEARIRRFLTLLLSGDIHIREQWRFWQEDFHFRSNRIVLKTTNAHFLEHYLVEANCHIVRFFRHPVSQSLSCLRNDWEDNLTGFAPCKPFRDRYLNTELCALLDHVDAEGDRFQRHILAWCCENLPLMRAATARTLVLHYEHLVTDPDTLVQQLAEHCDLPDTARMREMIAEPSASTRRNLSEATTVEAVKTGQTDMLVGRWNKSISDTQLAQAREILGAFPECPYSADETMPLAPSRVITP